MNGNGTHKRKCEHKHAHTHTHFAIKAGTALGHCFESNCTTFLVFGSIRINILLQNYWGSSSVFYSVGLKGAFSSRIEKEKSPRSQFFFLAGGLPSQVGIKIHVYEAIKSQIAFYLLGRPEAGMAYLVPVLPSATVFVGPISPRRPMYSILGTRGFGIFDSLERPAISSTFSQFIKMGNFSSATRVE